MANIDSKLNILIIDDDQAILEVLTEYLELEGWSTETAKNGFEGMNKAYKGDFDVIIMDLVMPRMDGLTATKEIVREKPDSKIIIITGNTAEDVETQAKDAGAKAFLKKPISLVKLIETIKQV
ncbi:MAG: response regulator [Calditrichaeota bacterium]|nr:response regulator [Calditrichota bacterium]